MSCRVCGAYSHDHNWHFEDSVTIRISRRDAETMLWNRWELPDAVSEAIEREIGLREIAHDEDSFDDVLVPCACGEEKMPSGGRYTLVNRDFRHHTREECDPRPDTITVEVRRDDAEIHIHDWPCNSMFPHGRISLAFTAALEGDR